MKKIFNVIQLFFAKPKTCSWCGHHGVSGDGNGIFMDTDFFPGKGFSYKAIPVCGGCGGLGVQFDTTDFKERTSKISDLRFKFYPVDKFPEPPSIVPYAYLKELISEVEQLVKIYAIDKDCYATRLIKQNSHARGMLKILEELVEVDLSVLRSNNPDLPSEYAEENRLAMIALYSGKFEEGFRLFEKLLEKFPEDPVLWHDYAVLRMTFSRDDSKIDQLWQIATTKEPKRALHFFQAGKYYWNIAKEPYLAIDFFEKAKSAPDWAEFQVAEAVDFDELIRLIKEEVYFSSPYRYGGRMPE